MAAAREQLAVAIRASGLVEPGSLGVALLSGGPDSACLAAGLAEVLGPAALTGLHINYGLREDSGEDEIACRRLCSELGVEIRVERAELGEGNVQDLARRARYQAAERLRAETGGAWIAVGHTMTDQAETLIYRLAVSPGRRALLGMAPRSAAVVRPLLGLGRADTRRLATEAGLPFRDDPSNRDRSFARVRVREEVLAVLRELNPAAERNIAGTRAELAEEAEVLEALAEKTLADAGFGRGEFGAGSALPVAALAELHPALRRLTLRSFFEAVSERPIRLGRERAEQVWRLALDAEGGTIELGEGVTVVCEAGVIRIRDAVDAEAPGPVGMEIPGECRFGSWSLRAQLSEPPVEPESLDRATLDAAAIGEALTVRSWREGDRMRPLGMEGTKTLQDLFTDRRVPRSLRTHLPVVVAGGEAEQAGEIAWIPGVAAAEPFRITAETSRVAILTASQTPRGPKNAK